MTAAISQDLASLTDTEAGTSQSNSDERRPAAGDGPLVRRMRIAFGACGALVGAYFISRLIRNDQTWPLLDSWGVAAFNIAVSCMGIGRALTVRSGRLTPLLLGLGCLAWGLGDLTLAAESVSGTPAVPSVADAFYISFYPLTYAGLVMLMRGQSRKLTLSHGLDGLIAGLGAAAICAAFLFDGVLRSAGGGALSVATNLAYPVGDLLLLAMVVGGTTVLPDRRNPRWLLLAAGCVINALGDTFNLFGHGIGATDTGSLINAIAWPASIVLICASVWLRVPKRDIKSYEHSPGFLLVGAATLASLVVLLDAALSFSVRPVAVVLAALTLVIAVVRSSLSVTFLRRLTAERHAQAITDQLTNLGNRRALFHALDILSDGYAADRDGDPSALLFIDLDKFKQVNDTYGHSVGDQLLRILGGRLDSALRGTDLVVRLGGDEFAVLLTNADADYGATVAQRIAAILEEPFDLGAVRARVGASIGIATMPADATDSHDIVKCADMAMYRAKIDGQDFAIYQEAIDGHGNRAEMIDELRHAIDTRQLTVHYQPQFDLGSREVKAVEALVRWEHPRLGQVPPLEFLPLAEDAELMDDLTALVLDTALAQCAAWRADGQELTVAVNVSTTNLLNPTFPDQVRRCLDKHELSAQALVIEITETTAITDFDRCKEVIEHLRNLGLVVSVDDFGAGFTSLAYLSSLAVDELKLDRSFINCLATAADKRNLALVRSTIDLAHALGLRVVAEGVEDADSLSLLTDMSCDIAQGYLISRPKPADELALVKDRA